MIKIGLLSDTHSFFDSRFFELFKDVDEIWHAGDIGNLEVLEQIENFKKTRAVYGNIDGSELRRWLNRDERFMCEGVDVWMTHIGGYPGRYDRSVKEKILANPPKLFISGHSHILKVMYDKKLDLLHINPGAAGKYGFHKIRTAVRFAIDGEAIKDLEVIELENRTIPVVK
ncbi:MAG: metallophosphoesterase family protein [Chlorobi bacterium]|nr:metallophosphoesterase family protein [Chlorobiota bacterium]